MSRWSLESDNSREKKWARQPLNELCTRARQSMDGLYTNVKQLPMEDLCVRVRQRQLGVRHLPLEDICVGVRLLQTQCARAEPWCGWWELRENRVRSGFYGSKRECKFLHRQRDIMIRRCSQEYAGDKAIPKSHSSPHSVKEVDRRRGRVEPSFQTLSCGSFCTGRSDHILFSQ